MKKHFSVLLDVFSKHAASGEPVNASECFTFLGFDLISELTFGRSWNMLSTGKPEPIIEEFLAGKKFLGFILLDIWLLHLLLALPPVSKRMQYWFGYYERALKERKEVCYPL